MVNSAFLFESSFLYAEALFFSFWYEGKGEGDGGEGSRVQDRYESLIYDSYVLFFFCWTLRSLYSRSEYCDSREKKRRKQTNKQARKKKKTRKQTDKPRST